MIDQILWTACVTPFNADGTSVQYQNLERLLRLQEKAQNGILLLGSTGESLSLSDKERREMVVFASSLNLTVPLMVGIPSINLQEALNFIDFCEDQPVTAYLMTTPLYTKPGVQGQIAWFEKLLDRASKPVMIYNNPGRAAVSLHPETVKSLASHSNFKAIKDCGSLESFMNFRMAAPHLSLFCGDDYNMPALAPLGAKGLVSVAANAWPEATRHYVQNSLHPKNPSDPVWWTSGSILFSASNPIPIKALMHDIGLLDFDTVRLPLSQKDLPDRSALGNLHTEITNNFRRNVV